MERATHERSADASRIAPVNALPPGARLQEFEILSVIGEGGFGIVYRAFDTALEREVAIKEYLPVSHALRIADGSVVASSERQRETFEKGLRCFMSEARMLARFKHRALVEILRFWEERGTAYMVMPYYHGRPLSQLVQEGLRIRDTATMQAFLAPLLDGLAMLHAANCYHRDISTDNILILEDGSPLLLDFGAARRILVDDSELMTVILKPGFAPIEQYSDDHAVAPQGAWTDLYALSAVAYQLVTGEMPMVSVARIIRDPLVPLSVRVQSGFACGLLAAIDAGLRVNPEQRPQSVAAFIDIIASGRPAADVVTPPATVQTPPGTVQNVSEVGLVAQTRPSAPDVPAAQSDDAPQPLPDPHVQPTVQPQMPSQPQTQPAPASGEKGAPSARVAVPDAGARHRTFGVAAGLVALVLAGAGLYAALDGEAVGLMVGVSAERKPALVEADVQGLTPLPALRDAASEAAAPVQAPADWSAMPSQRLEPIPPTRPNQQPETTELTEQSAPVASPAPEQQAVVIAAAVPQSADATPVVVTPPASDAPPVRAEMLLATPSPSPASNTAVSARAPESSVSPSPRQGPDSQKAAPAPTGGAATPPASAPELGSEVDATADPTVSQGTIDVRVEPWGSVFVNGQQVGVAPPRVRVQVDAGKVEVEVRNETHPPKHFTIDVEAGRTHRIKHVFGQG